MGEVRTTSMATHKTGQYRVPGPSTQVDIQELVAVLEHEKRLDELEKSSLLTNAAIVAIKDIEIRASDRMKTLVQLFLAMVVMLIATIFYSGFYLGEIQTKLNTLERDQRPHSTRAEP
jgi:hypothetical protein